VDVGTADQAPSRDPNSFVRLRRGKIVEFVHTLFDGSSDFGGQGDLGGKEMTGERAVLNEVSVGVGLVGLGYWGPNHLRVLQDSEQAGLRWLCDIDPVRLERFGRRTTADTTTELDRLLDDPGTDAVILSTPISTHHELALRCLEAGKHVMVEKPLATTREDADELIELAFERDLVLMCGHTFLFSPPVRRVRSYINSGELGEIYFVSSSRVNLGLHQKDVSVLWDLAPHDFSILNYWLGKAPEAIATVGRDSIVEGVADVAFVSLSYESGLIANVELSWLSPSKLRRTVVVGSEKMVVYDDGAAEPIRLYDHGVIYSDPESFGEFQLAYRTGDILSPRLETEEPIAVQLRAFLEAIDAGRADVEHLRVARDVVAMVEAAESSLSDGGGRVPVETGLVL
jgi:predicted dehydrogenase